MKPKYITLHCSASQNNEKTTFHSMREYHMKVKKWSDIGYHFVIETDGKIVEGRPLHRQGAHVSGHNKDNIGVCLVGGIDRKGNTENNFNINQMLSLESLVKYLSLEYDIDKNRIKGHRDWFGDTNKDGEINHRDWLKECPCFNVVEWVRKHLRYFS